MAVIGVMVILFFFVFFIAPIAAWFYAMYSICDHSADQFEAAGHNKWVWLGLNLVLGPLASAGYLIWARPALKQARQTGVNLTRVESIAPSVYPYPTEDTLAGASSKPIKSNEYFPEFDRDVA